MSEVARSNEADSSVPDKRLINFAGLPAIVITASKSGKITPTLPIMLSLFT